MKPGSSRPLKDILSGLVAIYNRMATAKKHRIDANRKALIYNMLLGFLKVNHLVATKMLIFIPIYPHYQDPHHQGYVPPMSFTRCSISTMISIGMNLQVRIRGLKVSRRGCHKDLNLPTSSHCAAWARNAAGGSPSWLVAAWLDIEGGSGKVPGKRSVERNPHMHPRDMPFVGNQNDSGPLLLMIGMCWHINLY